MIPLFGREVGVVFNKTKNFYGLSVESVKIEKHFNGLGIPSGIKRELFIPDWIKNNERYSKRFLRGFLDTDGSISCQRNYSIKNNTYHTQIRIHLSCISKNLMHEIYELLKSFNFKCTIRLKQPHGYGDKPTYEVKVAGGIQVNKWFEEIDSKNPKHITKYLMWGKFGFCPPYTKLNERMKMLKKEVSPYSYYKRRCRSGQTGLVKVQVA